MWSIMKKLGSCYGFYDQEEHHQNVHQMKLDPVAVAGGFDCVAMLASAKDICFCRKALQIISDEEVFKTTLRPPLERPKAVMVTTPPKWFPHFLALISFTLLCKSSAGACLMYASYFAVPKADGSARCIFNGKRLSKEHYRVPPPVQLPDFAELLRIICESFQGCTRIFLLSGDWRHWFHQLRMNDKIANHFGLTIKFEGIRHFYNWTCLPMGWSWSPWIAQSVGFGVLILTLHSIGWQVPKSVLEGESPPPFLLLKREAIIIFACLWYDNVLLITNDGDTRTQLFSAFKRTCDAYHVKSKHWQSYGGSSFLTNSVDPKIPEAPHLPIYLGVQFALSLKRHRSSKAQVTLCWRPDPAKEAKWRASIVSGRSAANDNSCTPRKVVTIIGRILWEQHISLRPLLLISDVIDVTRRCAHLAQGGWDVKQASLSLDMRFVCDHAESTLLTFAEWRTAHINGHAHTVTAAADASKLRGGYVVWDQNRSPLTPVGWYWNTHQAAMHIFVKELLSATILIEALCRVHRNTRLQIGIDNSAAAWCLRRLFSTTHHGQELIRRVYRALCDSGNTLDIVQLVSLDNPADVPTRMGKKSAESLADRCERFWRIVDGARSSNHRGHNNAGTVRHDERDLDDDGFESDDGESQLDPDEEFWDILSNMGEDEEVAEEEK